MSATSPRIEPLTFPRAQSLALSVVLTATDGGGRLREMLEALRAARIGVTYEVVVVVGGEPAAALGEIRRDYPLVLMYRDPVTADLGALYDLGARAAGGRHLLLLDGTAVPDAQAVAELVRFAETGQWIAAVVPRYAGAGDEPERPASRTFPTVFRAIGEAYGRASASADPVPRLQYALNRKVTTPKEIEAAVGGCVLVRRQAIMDVGGFQAGYEPGGEVLDWCMRARLRGWAVFYHPGTEARVLAGVQESPLARRAIARRFVRRFYGLVPAAVLALATAPQVAGAPRAAGASRGPSPDAAGPAASPDAAQPATGSSRLGEGKVRGWARA